MSMLRNATCMVHLNCQTAVETLMMGKLPISLEYVNSDRARHRFPIPSAVSFPASDFSELNEIVQAPGSYLARLSAADLYEQHILPTFFHNDGQAAARVADVVGRVQRHEQLGQSRLTSSLKGGFEHLVVGRLLQGTLSNIFGSKRIAALRAKTNPRRQAKAITCDEVQARLAAIAEADGSIAQVEVANATHPVTRQSMASILLSQHESA